MFFISVFDHNCNLLVPRPWTSKLHEKSSAPNREHSALQKMKFINFFLFLWVILLSWIRIKGPHDPIQIRITRLPPTQNLKESEAGNIEQCWVRHSTQKKNQSHKGRRKKR
jgi:hypothetical protein